MNDWTHKLFSEGDLADYLILRWERLLAAVHATRQDRGGPAIKLEDHLLQIPEPSPGIEIVEHGFLEQDPLLPAAVTIEVSTPEGVISLPHPRTYSVVHSPLQGNADLFRYRPPDCPAALPQGLVCGQNLCFRIERSGSADEEWKDGLTYAFLAIFDVLDLAVPIVDSYNEKVRNTITPKPAIPVLPLQPVL